MARPRKNKSEKKAAIVATRTEPALRQAIEEAGEDWTLSAVVEKTGIDRKEVRAAVRLLGHDPDERDDMPVRRGRPPKKKEEGAKEKEGEKKGRGRPAQAGDEKAEKAATSGAVDMAVKEVVSRVKSEYDEVVAVGEHVVREYRKLASVRGMPVETYLDMAVRFYENYREYVERLEEEIDRLNEEIVGLVEAFTPMRMRADHLEKMAVAMLGTKGQIDALEIRKLMMLFETEVIMKMGGTGDAGNQGREGGEGDQGGGAGDGADHGRNPLSTATLKGGKPTVSLPSWIKGVRSADAEGGKANE